MDKRNSIGQTPLIVAVECKNMDRLEACLSLRRPTTDVNATDMWGRTSLMYAAQGCDLVAAQRLLSCGADGSLEDRYGETALIKACKSENLQMCTLLVQRGCGIFHKNRNGWSPLSMAKRLETLYTLLRADPALWLDRVDDLIAEIRVPVAAAAEEVNSDTKSTNRSFSNES